jgi:hypothetical protein
MPTLPFVVSTFKTLVVPSALKIPTAVVESAAGLIIGRTEIGEVTTPVKVGEAIGALVPI